MPSIRSKEGVIDAAKTLYDCLTCMEGMIATMKINKDAMRVQAEKGYLAATDVADYLAKKGMPFRQAHEVVGHLVLLCDKRGCNLDDLSLEDFKAESELFEEDITGALDLESIVAARTTFGGTSREALHDQMQLAEDSYTQDNDYFFQYPQFYPTIPLLFYPPCSGLILPKRLPSVHILTVRYGLTLHPHSS